MREVPEFEILCDSTVKWIKRMVTAETQGTELQPNYLCGANFNY